MRLCRIRSRRPSSSHCSCSLPVFFSGFVLAIDEFSEPVRSLIYALPVANGIRLIGDFMFRGGTVAVSQIWLLGGLALGYTAGAWLLLRRVLSRA